MPVCMTTSFDAPVRWSKDSYNRLSKTPPLPTPRQAAFLFLRCPEKLRVQEQETLIKLCQINLEVNLAMSWFSSLPMLRSRTGESLDAWLARLENSNLPELQSFASGIEKDKEAVGAGLTWWEVNGMWKAR